MARFQVEAAVAVDVLTLGLAALAEMAEQVNNFCLRLGVTQDSEEVVVEAAEHHPLVLAGLAAMAPYMAAVEAAVAVAQQLATAVMAQMELFLLSTNQSILADLLGFSLARHMQPNLLFYHQI
jgi:hypothetical protein